MKEAVPHNDAIEVIPETKLAHGSDDPRLALKSSLPLGCDLVRSCNEKQIGLNRIRYPESSLLSAGFQESVEPILFE
jgi:hypothetical protein